METRIHPLARLVAGRGLLALLRRRCLALTAGPVVESVQAVARRIGLGRAISIRQARGALGPATFGVWRPTLLLPQDFATDFDIPALDDSASEAVVLEDNDTALESSDFDLDDSAAIDADASPRS